nr:MULTISPECIES: serine/threonine-protein kinase [unclassified Frankia]
MTEPAGTIGRYRVAQRLGAGGMGEVFLAHSRAGSPVAVKVIRPDRLDPHTRERFEREARIARTVVGTNRVARFLDADPFADRPWLAMEYVPGRTLLEHIQEFGVLPPHLVASLGLLLAEGLEAVHAANLLHRDLKPQNIMLGADGPIIIDFGLGAFLDAPPDSLSHSGDVIGTARCMPPEQASGRGPVTSAADVYAFGTVLLYAAAGHYPYDGQLWQEIATKVVRPDVAPDLSEVPEPLLPLLAGMLAHEAAARPSLDEIAMTCAALLTESRTTAMEARLALIARTSGDLSPPPDSTAGLPPGVESDPAGVDDESGPLDGLRSEEASTGLGTPGGQPASDSGRSPVTGGTPLEAPEAATGSDGTSLSRRAVKAGRRHPRQVAERLRVQYALGSPLVGPRR